jgi:hypothetical protein
MNVDWLGVGVASAMVWGMMGLMWLLRRDIETTSAANAKWWSAAVVLIMAGPWVWVLILIGFTSAIWAGLRGRTRKGTEA